MPNRSFFRHMKRAEGRQRPLHPRDTNAWHKGIERRNENCAALTCVKVILWILLIVATGTKGGTCRDIWRNGH